MIEIWIGKCTITDYSYRTTINRKKQRKSKQGYFKKNTETLQVTYQAWW